MRPSSCSHSNTTSLSGDIAVNARVCDGLAQGVGNDRRHSVGLVEPDLQHDPASVVDRGAHGTGCGSALLAEVERRLEALHARMLVIETSSRSDYAATRTFYLRRGYVEAVRVREFYAPQDDRIILTKRLAGSPRQGWGAVA